MTVPYVHSNYPRIADDNYQTVDKRCVKALVETIKLDVMVADCCSKNGSGIVRFLRDMGHHCHEMTDAFESTKAQWIVSNPPYDRKVVDTIIWAQLARLSSGVDGVAMLLRNNFDFAKTRYEMFTHPLYWGQIHMMFRPWWSAEKKHQPIHNYVWHIWKAGKYPEKIVKYWRES